MKVVWLCHFADQSTKEHFNASNVNETAPWINKLIELFQSRSEIELHIIAPNIFNNKDYCIKKNGIHYHFYKIMPIPNYNIYIRKLYSVLRISERTNFCWEKYRISQYINRVNPDIIHLHGAENPYYSAGVIPFLDTIPVLVTVQGFIRNSSQRTASEIKRILIEETILKQAKHIGVRTDEMTEIVSALNPNAKLHFHNYPVNIPPKTKDNIGKYEPIDCLFFARVSRDKGIEDLLKAISIVKISFPNINVKIIGGASKSYLQYLNKICADSDIIKNIQFTGFLETQEQIFNYALQSKMCVLPTYHDIIPGTIIESMYLKLPVISYAVGGIPELNKKVETVLLVNKSDINGLAEKIILLLNDIELRKILAERAYHNAVNRFNNNNVTQQIINIYQTILQTE